MTATATRAATVRISARLNSALNTQAKLLRISKALLIRQALEEKLEDIQDAKLIEERRNERSIPHDQFWKKVGLEG